MTESEAKAPDHIWRVSTNSNVKYRILSRPTILLDARFDATSPNYASAAYTAPKALSVAASVCHVFCPVPNNILLLPI